jgi:hypothetical protein
VPPRLTLQRRTATTDFRSRALRALHEHRPRPASSRPVPGRRSGVNADACNITAPSATLPQSLASSLGGSSAARPSGSQKGRLCLAPRPDGARSRCAALLQRPACALALSRQREGLARRCAQGWRTSPARPGPSAARACGPAGLRSRARSRPSRPPRKRGSPKFNGNPGPWGEEAPAVCPGSIAPCSPRQGFASPLRALDPAATRR